MIEVNGLTRYYGEFPALTDVSFSVGDAEIVGLLGLNGAGKSTALKILAGLMVPSRGTVLIDGIDVEDDPAALASRIGFLPENPPLYDDMTVEAFLSHVGRLKGMSADAVARRLPEVIDLCDLQGRERQLIGTLSHGYRKRVGIAQTIIHDPKLVILDEPISGLDPAQIVEMRQVLRGLGQGRAVMISSHILSEISQTCDRILVLHDGKLVAQGTEAELAARAQPVTRLVLTVRGEPDAFVKWLDAHDAVSRVERRDAPEGQARCEVALDDSRREALLAELVSAGFGLRLVEQPEDELEEIFLGLTAAKEAAA